ncbi:MAG TPA: hypothetical protein GX707_06005 [Epulopiscium sp.]|nr:hypothetical protein [Candidatus Epulonipiscium sp.]
MSKFKKVIEYILTFVLVLTVGMGFNSSTVYATSAISGNNTMETAYNCGSWGSMNSQGTAVLDKDESQSWFKVTVAAGERIYVRTSSDEDYVGMSVQIKNSAGIDHSRESINPRDLIYPTIVTPALYVDINNDSSTTKSYYVVVDRGEVFEESMYFSLSAGNRIRTGSGTFSFSRKASNPGNTSMNLNGVDSTVIALNLTNNVSIPGGAIVTSVNTSGAQSPNQGNVHHMINPSSTPTWYTSRASSATSGMYHIDVDDDFSAKQVWNFKYNAKSIAKSTMSSVKLALSWQYDMNQTNYQIFIK